MASILIVDGSEDHSAAIARILDGAGFDTVQFRNCESAYEHAVAAPPALLLTDAFMPEMDGFLLARRLTKNPRTADVPVVMMASAPYATHKIRALWYGARQMITRPVDDGELLDAVFTFARYQPGLREAKVAY